MRKLNDSEKARVNFIVSDIIGADEEEVTTESLLKEDLGADSLDAIEICMEIEKEFNINIPDSDFENVKTVSELYECVERYL